MVLFTPMTTVTFAGWKFNVVSAPTPLGMMTTTTGGEVFVVCVVDVFVVVIVLLVVDVEGAGER
jgi:hypothetical protein